jgi:hypothetical protein
MPYDTELEKRIDRLVPAPERLEKKKMFGGVGYLLQGKMAFGIHKQALIIRTRPEQASEWIESGSALPFDITGRPMKGWAMFSPQKISGDRQLLNMLAASLEYVRALPEK